VTAAANGDAMPKNIVLCSDGTGNRDIKGRGTNVFKLFEAVDLNEHRTNPELDTQLAFYDDGVGTGGSLFRRIGGEAAGLGLRENVKELYRELSRVYDAGDSIFLFGFSRGAFTVRTLAGMIGACGVLKGEKFETARSLRSAVDDAYNAYRAKYSAPLTNAFGKILRWPGREELIERFERHPATRRVQIAFIGVWDTVDAVGMPFASADFINHYVYQFKFGTHQLGNHVMRAAHALAIDDQRRAFEPVLWTGKDPRIAQVWFAGVHSNVGGGYPKQGMSLVALDWMLGHAEDCGLRLQPIDRELFRGHACVDDLLYDSRSGAGLFYRWAPRDIRKLCADNDVDPCIHLSVAERIAHATDDYAPGNIPSDVSVVPTRVRKDDSAREQKERVLQHRAAAVEATIRDAMQGRYLLDDAGDHIHLGRQSYVLFLVAWLAIVVSASVTIAWLLSTWTSKWLVLGLWAGAFGTFWRAEWLSRCAADAMSDQFSSFWQRHQKDLRTSLKRAKEESSGKDNSSTKSDLEVPEAHVSGGNGHCQFASAP
jgi:uncharacterized protein (DUF2235 family)